jgi:hypothetical protein
VGDELSYAEVMNRLSVIEHTVGRTVNPTIYNQAEVQGKIQQGNAFLTRVLAQEKLWIKGSEHDIGTFTEPRTDR